MKKILLIALLFFAAVSVGAQVTLRPGIRAGANLSSITGTDLDSKLDFYIGGFAALNFQSFIPYSLRLRIHAKEVKGIFHYMIVIQGLIHKEMLI